MIVYTAQSVFADIGLPALSAVTCWAMVAQKSKDRTAPSEERFRRVLESSSAVIYQLDLSSRRYTYMSPAVQRILGYSPETALSGGLPFTYERMHPDDIPKVEQRRSKMLDEKAEGRFYEVEYRMRRSDGRYVWFSDSAELVMDDEGRPIATVGTATDITARKSLEEENERYREELQRLLEVSRQLAGELDETRVLEVAVRGVTSAIANAEAASVWLVEDDGSVAVPAAWVGHDDDEMRALRVSVDRSMVGEVISGNRSILVRDTRACGFFQLLDQPVIDSTRSVIGVPLTTDGEVVGALFADRFDPEAAFQERDLKLIQALGAQAGVALQNARLLEHVRGMTNELIEAQEGERRRIAHELHDEIGGQLTSLSLSVGLAKRHLKAEGAGERSLEELESSEELINALADQVRGMALQLRPSVLDDLGLAAAVKWLADRYEKQTGISVDLRCELTLDDRYDPHIEISTYRLVQEALSNVARHARVDVAEVVLEKTAEGLHVSVRDEGVGFRHAGIGSFRGSLGLAGMYERISKLGGRLDVESQPGGGTSVDAHVPV